LVSPRGGVAGKVQSWARSPVPRAGPRHCLKRGPSVRSEKGASASWNVGEGHERSDVLGTSQKAKEGPGRRTRTRALAKQGRGAQAVHPRSFTSGARSRRRGVPWVAPSPAAGPQGSSSMSSSLHTQCTRCSLRSRSRRCKKRSQGRSLSRLPETASRSRASLPSTLWCLSQASSQVRLSLLAPPGRGQTIKASLGHKRSKRGILLCCWYKDTAPFS